MPNAVKWETPVSETDLLTTELNSMTASGGLSTLGAAFDNQAGKDRWASFVLNVTFGTAPTAGGTVDLYLVPRIDLTNFADSSDPLQLSMLVATFTVRNTTSAQRIAGAAYGPPGGIITRLAPLQYKAIAVNNADQAFPASGSTLSMTTFVEEVQ